MERLPRLQAAVRGIEGVAAAFIRWPDPQKPATLAVTFAAGADREAVRERVLAAVEDILGIARSEFDVRMAGTRQETGERDAPAPEETAGATQPQRPSTVDRRRPGRPVLSRLVVERERLDSSVTVTLTCGGRSASASVHGAATARQTPKTAALAALLALREFLPSDVRVALESVEAVPSGAADDGLVQASVSCISAAAEERFVGTAIVRGDLREAAVRATLDALNRRLQRPAPDQLVLAS